MKIWPDVGGDSGSGGGTGGSASAVAYKKVQLVEDKPVCDLFIFKQRGKSRFGGCFGEKELWLEEGRPRQLSSLPLATWSLLTTSVKEYQRGLREVNLRIARRIILPAYFVWLICVILSMNYVEEGELKKGQLLSAFSWWGLIIVVLATIFIIKHYTNQHLDETFHPAIQTVLQELDSKLLEAGYEVQLFVEKESYAFDKTTFPFFIHKTSATFLRFTPTRDLDRDATAAAAVEAPTGGGGGGTAAVAPSTTTFAMDVEGV